MYIATIPNRSSLPAILLREGYREGGKVKTRTLANLSKLLPEAIAALRQVLQGDQLVPASEAFEAVASLHHGHVQAVLNAMRRLGFTQLIARGMIAQKQVEALRKIDGIDWVAALRPEAIRKLLAGGALQLGLFDERNLFELTHPDFPNERWVACRNPELAKRRAHKRTSLLEATTKELEKVRRMVGRGRLLGQDDIGVRVGKVVNKYKVAKHFRLTIEDTRFDFEVDTGKVAAEAALDGLYVIRTSLSEERMSAEQTVRSYKQLTQVERAFRSFKTLDLEIRPIHHRLENRVRAHIFLCMLAYYVRWHMLEAWRPLLFCDEDQRAKATRDPVAPARRSEAALRKVHFKTLDDGSEVHSFHTLLKLLSGIVRNSPSTSLAWSLLSCLSTVMLEYRCVDLLWRPVGRTVRFVIVRHPKRGTIFLMATDTTLDPLQILMLYSHRFKIEVGFKQALHVLGSYAYHFWMQDMTRIRARSGDQYLHMKTDLYREQVRRKINAYHLHVQLGCVAQGLLQHLALNHGAMVWRQFRSWLRTMDTTRPPSELVTAYALRDQLPEFLNEFAQEPNTKKFMRLFRRPRNRARMRRAA